MELSNKEAFTLICGDCAGVDIGNVTKEDVIKMVKYWNELFGVCSELNEVCSEKMLQAAIKGLKEYQEGL